MLHTTHDVTPDLCPVNLTIHLLVQQSTDNHILAADQIQAMRNLLAILGIVWGTYDPLYGIFEDKVGHLVAREKCTGEGSAIGGENKDLL